MPAATVSAETRRSTWLSFQELERPLAKTAMATWETSKWKKLQPMRARERLRHRNVRNAARTSKMMMCFSSPKGMRNKGVPTPLCGVDGPARPLPRTHQLTGVHPDIGTTVIGAAEQGGERLKLKRGSRFGRVRGTGRL